MDSSGKGMSHGPAPLSQPGHLVWLRVTRFGLAQTNRCHDPDPAVPSICPDPTLHTEAKHRLFSFNFYFLY